MRDEDGEAIELDTNLHCRDLTIRELEFSMVGNHPGVGWGWGGGGGGALIQEETQGEDGKAIELVEI